MTGRQRCTRSGADPPQGPQRQGPAPDSPGAGGRLERTKGDSDKLLVVICTRWLNTQVNASLADANFQARLANLGATVLPGSPADFAKLIADETMKWGKVILAANIKAE